MEKPSERQKIHKPLKNIANPAFRRANDATNVLGSNTSLEIPVPDFVPSGNIRKSDGKIILPIPFKMGFPAYFSGSFQIDAPFLQISKQYPVGKRNDFQILKGGICLFKRTGNSNRFQYGSFILNTL